MKNTTVYNDKNDIRTALKTFKRNVKESGILAETFDRKFYKKPSDTKRKARENAKFKQQSEDTRTRV